MSHDKEGYINKPEKELTPITTCLKSFSPLNLTTKVGLEGIQFLLIT